MNFRVAVYPPGKAPEQIMVPIKWTDEGRTLRMTLKTGDPGGGGFAKEKKAFTDALTGDQFHFERVGNVVKLYPQGKQGASVLLICSEGRDDAGFLWRMFPMDIGFEMKVALISPTEAAITTTIASLVDGESAPSPAISLGTDDEIRERATMFNMPDASKASADRIRAWLKFRSEAVANAATPMGAAEFATRKLGELDKAPKTKNKPEPVAATG